jgi:hypothetical protein
MTTRTHRKTSSFAHPFLLKGVDRVLPPGDYEVVTEEELIEGLSFPVYHRVSTVISVPGQTRYASSTEMVPIDPLDLEAAHARDTNSQLPSSKTAPADALIPSGHTRREPKRS